MSPVQIDFFQAVLDYRQRGWSVIPVDAASKKPLVRWNEFQNRLPTEEEIKSWRPVWSNGIGIVTGRVSGLVVIDCDSEEAANRFVEQYPEAKDTRQAQTGRGRHFYFQFEDGIRNDAGKILGPEIDVRGEGGFVIVPPSIHGNRQPYKWLNQNEPLPLPEKLKEALLKRANEKSNTDELAVADRIPEGQRDDTLTSIAGFMRRKGLDAEAIQAALLPVNKLRCDPPLPESAVEKIAGSVARYPSDPSPMAPDVMDGSEITWAKDVPPPGEGEEIQTLWGPFLYPASLHLLAGDAGVGKTTFGYNLVISLVRGEPFAGFSPKRRLRVLYYDLETPPLLFKQKLHRISQNNPPEGLAFARSFSFDGAKKFAQAHSFDLIIIDTGNEAFGTREEEDNAEANRQMQQLRKLIQETQVAILVFYHMAKDPSQKGVYKLRGASARPAAADVVLNVEHAGMAPAQSNGTGTNLVEVIKLEVAKNRWGEKASLTLKKAGEDRFEIAESSGAHDVTREGLTESFILKSLPCGPDVIETKKILQLGSSKGIPKPTIERALNKLVKAGVVQKPRRGTYCLPSIHLSLSGCSEVRGQLQGGIINSGAN